MPGPRIARGDRVTLRSFERDDVPFLQRSYVNPEIRTFIGHPLLNEENLVDWIADDDADRFLVCLDDEGSGPGHVDEEESRRVGVITVEDAAWKRPELTYWLVPEVHGEGYGTEAVSLVLGHVFRTHDTPAVGAGAYAFNDASRGLLGSLGFEEEGRRRRYRFIDGEYVDLVLYGLLREDWDGWD